MTRGKSEYGEYLLLVFKVEEQKKNAYLLLSPVSNPQAFQENFRALTGRGHADFKPSPKELESFCRQASYQGEVEAEDGVARVTSLSLAS